jgi:hypothetical protein
MQLYASSTHCPRSPYKYKGIIISASKVLSIYLVYFIYANILPSIYYLCYKIHHLDMDKSLKFNFDL